MRDRSVGQAEEKRLRIGFVVAPGAHGQAQGKALVAADAGADDLEVAVSDAAHVAQGVAGVDHGRRRRQTEEHEQSEGGRQADRESDAAALAEVAEQALEVVGRVEAEGDDHRCAEEGVNARNGGGIRGCVGVEAGAGETEKDARQEGAGQGSALETVQDECSLVSSSAVCSISRRKRRACWSRPLRSAFEKRRLTARMSASSTPTTSPWRARPAAVRRT